MAYTYVTLFKDKTFKSVTSEDQTAYAILDKTCMYIRLPPNRTEKEFQKESGGGTGDVYIAKMVELISKMNPKDGWIGMIYFKTEKNEVFPKLFLDLHLRSFIRDNLPNPVLHLEGIIRLEGGSSATLASKSKHIYKSCTFQDPFEMRSLTLSPPFPFDMVQPVKNCRWILESFSLWIGYKDEGWLGGNLKSNSGQLLQTLFGGNCSPKDFILVAGNGAEIPFHGQILAAKSPALAAMVNPSGAMKESESKRIEMNAFSEESLKAFVSFVYCQPVPLKEMDCDTVLELFRLGHMYQLPELTKNLSKMMLHKGEEWFSPNCILELHFFLKNLSEFQHLANHAVNVLLKLGDSGINKMKLWHKDRNNM